MPSPSVLPECLPLMMCSLYIYTASASGTLHYNLPSVIFTINLQSLFPKVKVPPKTLLHFSNPSISVSGYFSTLSWSLPHTPLPSLESDRETSAYKSSLDTYSQHTGRWQTCRCPEGLNAAPLGTRVTLGHPKGLTHKDRTLILPCPALRHADHSFLPIYYEE